MQIKDLTPDPENANKGTPRGESALEESISSYGLGRSILIDKNNRIIAGNKTAQKAGELGIEQVTVVETTGNQVVAVKRTDLDLDEDNEARELAYADNRTSELSLDWDPEQLLKDSDRGINLPFTDDELRGLTGKTSEAEGPGAEVDRASELKEKWGTESGQLWKIGNHRLLCGDCTKVEDVERLTDGQKANMSWIDPPYGVDYGAKLEPDSPMPYRIRTIRNDGLPDAELKTLINTALRNMASVSVVGASVYMAAPPGPPLPTLIAAFDQSGFEFRWQLVWVKDQFVFSRSDYHFRHENILYGWKTDGAHWFTGDRTQDSVFEVDRPHNSEEHPTMKPVLLVSQMIENSAEQGQIVLDAFLGSGSTMVAAEQTGRTCYGMEIEPKYIAVTLERMQQMGLEPCLKTKS